MMVNMRNAVAATAVACTLVGLGAIGCRAGTGFEPWRHRQAPTPEQGPAPSSPAGVVRSFEWSYNRRSLAQCRELFTDDYRFNFSPGDSSGSDYRDTPWTRTDELISTAHLFEGGSAAEPPAAAITLVLDQQVLHYPDPSCAAWDPEGRRHQVVQSNLSLRVHLDDGSSAEIAGQLRFYLVRGDSARIPGELLEHGFRPDSMRWYIQRWDDETPETGGMATAAAAASRPARSMRALPSRALTWGRLKVAYR